MRADLLAPGEKLNTADPTGEQGLWQLNVDFGNGQGFIIDGPPSQMQEFGATIYQLCSNAR